MRKVTICFLINKRGDKIVSVWLAMKKRGFGKERWNGAGGKFSREEGDKNISDTADRENRQEIKIKTIKKEKVAIIDFIFPKLKKFFGHDQQAHIYLVEKWKGSPKESEEMKPRLFSIKSIPYEKMWDDDIFWLPVVLAGNKMRAKCLFGKDKKTKSFSMEVVRNLK